MRRLCKSHSRNALLLRSSFDRTFHIMKKYICILAGAALLAACEQKTETAAPAASASPEATTSTTTESTTTPAPTP
jgi:uncharacterized lipoprotein YajG